MRYVALDLDKKTALATFLHNNQAQPSHKRIELHERGLTQFVNTLSPDDILCLEDCPGSYHVAERLRPYVAEVQVVNPVKFGRIIEANKHKNDRNDSGLMARLAKAEAIPQVWQPDAETRDDRILCDHLLTLQADQIRYRNRVHALLTEFGFGPQADTMVDLESERLLARLEGRMTDAALQTLASHLRILTTIEQELVNARAQVVSRAAKDERCDLIATLPGVDHSLALAMRAAIGTIQRFKKAESVRNYAGLTPTLHSSGPGKPKHGRITKRGSRLLRQAAVAAARNAVRTPGRLKNKYDRLRRKGKCWCVAIVAVAGDILEILWHMMTKREAYRDTTTACQQRKAARRRRAKTAAHSSTIPDVYMAIRKGLGTIRQALDSMAR